MNEIRNLYSKNSLFFLVCLTLILTIGLVNWQMGIFFLIVLIGMVLLTLKYWHKPDFSYSDYVIELLRRFNRRIDAGIKKREDVRLANEKAAAVQSMIRDQELRKRNAERDKVLRARAEMLRAQMEASLENKDVAIPSTEELMHSLRQEQVKQNVTSNVQSSERFIDDEEEFKFKKHGGIFNGIFLILGMLPIWVIYSFFANYLNAQGIGYTLAVILFFGFIVDCIYYLPTLLYNASFGGKLLIWILNTFFSWTVIGWIILLILTHNHNKDVQYHEEMLFHARRR